MPGAKRKSSVRHRRNAKRLKKACTERTHPPALIHMLNDDCLEKIFGYLSIKDKFSVQKVCKRWRENNQLAWGDVRSLNFNHPELLAFPTQRRECLLKFFSACGYFLHELITGHSSKSFILPIISQYCHNLTKLDIQLNCSDDTCGNWFPQMERLQYLKLEGRNQHFSTNFFQTLPHENLTELHLSTFIKGPQCRLPRVASSALEKLTKLSALTLAGFILTPTMMTIINQKSSLTYLALAYCTASRESPCLDRLRNLEKLILKKFFEVNDHLLTQISETCKSLKYLDLSGCFRVSNEGITKLQVLSQLEELLFNIVYKISDEPLSKMHSLKTLECSNCYNVNDNGIITLIRYAPNLEYLDLTSSNVSAKMLMRASEVIRRRTNGIILRIRVSSAVRRHWNQDDCPPLLVVESDPLGDTSSDSSELSDSSDTDYSSELSDSSDDSEAEDARNDNNHD